MRCVLPIGVSAALGVCASALATPTLQLDVNAIGLQVHNAQGANSAFGGLTHTGSINFSFISNATALEGIYVQSSQFGPWIDQGFSGSLTNFTGTINLTNGLVTGGSVSVTAGADSYSCGIVPDIGQVQNYIGGGFTVQGLTFQGAFSDSTFGNVDVSPWFAANGGLFGSFLEFNFQPNEDGAGVSDMELFVDTVPLPPAAWAGMATMAGFAAFRYARKSGRARA
jgi:hypothetical protein